MSGALTVGHMWSIAVLMILAPTPSRAQVIDFETLPGGGSTVDQQTISTEYASLGVTFVLLDRTTGSPIGYPRIAKTGPPETAFQGCYSPDSPRPYLDYGVSFLTDGTALGVEGDLRVEYATPVAQASGVFLDIDCRVNGVEPCEHWTVTAYDVTGAVLDSVVLDAPQGATNPECANPGAGPGDSGALGWAIDIGAAMIKSIVFRYTGTVTFAGLALDDFRVSSLPGPPAVFTTSPADTICSGELISLSAFVSGGSPPFGFQWQRETTPSTWADLGTEDTQPIRPFETSNYRVVVTDASDQQTTSPVVTIVTESGGQLCESTLLVSSFLNNRVIRYSLRSGLYEVLVSSGSGGLSNAAGIVCGPDGDVYVSSQDTDEVLHYDGNTGAFVEVFVAAGSGGLDFPVDLAFGPDDNLYVVSSANHSIIRYDGSTGAFIDVFVPTGSGLNAPGGLVFGFDDNLYVCSRDSDKVLRFDGTTGAPLGDFVTSGSGGLDQPRGLTFGSDGNLYVGELVNNSVRRYDGSTGAFIDVFIPSGSGGLDRANDVVFAPNGRLYVTSFDTDKVLAYHRVTGAFLEALPDGVLDGPAWVTLGNPPVLTGVRESTVPRTLFVDQNVPNPFNPGTTVGFTLPTAGHTRVTIVDVTGRMVATLLDESLPAGRHSVKWDGHTADGHNASSGVYFLRVESGGASAARKILLLR